MRVVLIVVGGYVLLWFLAIAVGQWIRRSKARSPMTTFPGAADAGPPAGPPSVPNAAGLACVPDGGAAPVHQSEAGRGGPASDPRSDLPRFARMASRLKGAGRSEPTLLHMTWLPWPVRLIHTRGAL